MTEKRYHVYITFSDGAAVHSIWKNGPWCKGLTEAEAIAEVKKIDGRRYGCKKFSVLKYDLIPVTGILAQ